MSKITLFDGNEIIITEQEAGLLQAALDESTDGFVTISGRTIKKNAISSILPGGITEADVSRVFGTDRQLATGSGCRGQRSIQSAINKMAVKLSGKHNELNPDGWKWARLAADADWREMMRAKIREQKPGPWCDNKAGECACKAEYIPKPGRHRDSVNV